MRHCALPIMLIILTSMAFFGCNSKITSDSIFLSGTWQDVGLKKNEIKSLDGKTKFIFAGSRKGFFKKQIGSNNNQWLVLGFEGRNTEVRDFVIFNNQHLVLTVWNYGSSTENEPTFYQSKDGGNSWKPVETTFKREKRVIQISYLEGSIKNSQILYAYNGSIIKSKNQGAAWDSSYTGQVSYFITVSPFQPHIIWTGGTNPIFSPYLAKSEDGGDSWTLLNDSFYFNAEATVYDIIIDNSNENHVLAGTGGVVPQSNVIRKSTDAGKSWETVLKGINVRTFTHSARDPEIVYASGRNGSGTLFFAASGNFGDSWETIEMENSPANIQVNDMVSVIEDEKEVLYFGTNNGVYRYTFKQ